MNDLGADTGALVFLLFCRIGACLMVMPGVSSARVPARVRLFLAIATTLALSPLLLPHARATAPEPESAGFLAAIVAETAIGLANGLVARVFFLALEAMFAAAAMSVGLTANLGIPIEGEDAVPTLASLLTLTATALMFMTDIHWQLLRGLIDTYRIIPIGAFDSRLSLVGLADAASASFTACLRVASPFIVLGLVVNLAFGLLNRMVPQVQIYFVALPFTAFAGLALLYAIAPEAIAQFLGALAASVRAR